MKEATSFRLSPRALELLKAISDRLGVSQASTLEMLIRERADFLEKQDRAMKYSGEDRGWGWSQIKEGKK